MKKSDIFEIAWHLYDNVDQADHDYTIKHVLQTATIEGLKVMIESLLRDEGGPEWSADEEIVKKAKKLCGIEEDLA